MITQRLSYLQRMVLRQAAHGSLNDVIGDTPPQDLQRAIEGLIARGLMTTDHAITDSGRDVLAPMVQR